MKPDLQAMAERMVEAVRSLVAKTEAVLHARLDQIEQRVAEVPPKGDKGDKGEPGEPGGPGKDADPEVIRALVAEAVEAIPKPKDGTSVTEEQVQPLIARAVAAGFDAALAGMPRPKDGADGKDVDPVVVRAMVTEAVNLAVAALPRAKDGEPGRDAAELDVLPSIDEGKSYRRGTWASHRNGLIRAARQTEPRADGDILRAGWVVMVEGLAGFEPTQGEDPRVIEIAATLTSGARSVSRFVVPMVLDRGVWREGVDYTKGDHVTWDGSGWIAQRATTDKPGTSDAFRLSTKRGRDGRPTKGSPPPADNAPVRLR